MNMLSSPDTLRYVSGKTIVVGPRSNLWPDFCSVKGGDVKWWKRVNSIVQFVGVYCNMEKIIRVQWSDAGERDPCKIGERDANFDL